MADVEPGHGGDNIVTELLDPAAMEVDSVVRLLNLTDLMRYREAYNNLSFFALPFVPLFSRFSHGGGNRGSGQRKNQGREDGVHNGFPVWSITLRSNRASSASASRI
jgi:hypothetical protein